MKQISRRQLAKFTADSLIAGKPVNELAKAIAGELVVSRRKNQVEFLVKDIEAELQASKVLANVDVYGRFEPDASILEQVVGLVKAETGASEVAVNYKTDPKILGGIRIETAAVSWDFTLNRKLDNLKVSAKEEV